MVRVQALGVLGSVEASEPFVKVVLLCQGHLRRTERRNDLEPDVHEVDDSAHALEAEASESGQREIVDLDLASSTERGCTPAAPGLVRVQEPPHTGSRRTASRVGLSDTMAPATRSTLTFARLLTIRER